MPGIAQELPREAGTSTATPQGGREQARSSPGMPEAVQKLPREAVSRFKPKVDSRLAGLSLGGRPFRARKIAGLDAD